MTPLALIHKYYAPGSLACRVLVEHSRCVQAKALAAARCVRHLRPDVAFIRDAAMLHDIGIFLTDAPDIGCTGTEPYIRHGVLGCELLRAEGLGDIALVCERHTGTGLSVDDIRSQSLPLPMRDMQPVSLEEQIVCYADNFYSKRLDSLKKERTPAEVLARLAKFGPDKVARFREWHVRFGGPDLRS